MYDALLTGKVTDRMVFQICNCEETKPIDRHTRLTLCFCHSVLFDFLLDHFCFVRTAGGGANSHIQKDKHTQKANEEAKVLSKPTVERMWLASE